MPIYEYRCDNGHNFEVMQRMTDDPVVSCQTCEAPVQRVFHPIAVHFKGKGFYNTDYGTRKRQRETAAAAESGADKHDAKRKDGGGEGSSSAGKESKAGGEKGSSDKGSSQKGSSQKGSSAPATKSSTSSD